MRRVRALNAVRPRYAGLQTTPMWQNRRGPRRFSSRASLKRKYREARSKWRGQISGRTHRGVGEKMSFGANVAMSLKAALAMLLGMAYCWRCSLIQLS